MTSIIQRVCKCGCGTLFHPHAKRPGQEYRYGHKPKSDARPAPQKLRAHTVGRSEEDRRVLDYRLALQTARRELAIVTGQIDQVDDEIDVLRKDLHTREAQKEMLTERHLNIDSTIMALDALVSGKSLVREIAAQ